MAITPTESCWRALQDNFKFLLVAVTLCATAMAQYQRGTVVALVTSPQGTIMAADSRNDRLHGKISDDLCKVLTFGNKIAVALGGVSGHTSPLHPPRNWDGFKQLGLAYAKDSRSARTFAAEWASEMTALILRDMSDDPAPLISAIEGWNGNRGAVLVGIFVGPDDLESFAVRLSLVRRGDIFDVVTEYLQHPPHDCDFVCGAVGTEIIDQIKSASTLRARAWHKTMSQMSPPDRAIEAIQLTIKNYPQKRKVGGAVDAVLVSRNGIRWIQRKCNCSE